MPDDFILIRGINQKTANRLHEAGILTYEKLASMTPEEIIARIGLGAGITAESISKKDWTGQAAKLAEAAHAKKESEETMPPGSNLHAVSYVVELFLDGQDAVTRTKLRHIQSEEEEEWTGWDESKMRRYFLRRPELNLPKPQQPVHVLPSSQSVVEGTNAAPASNGSPENGASAKESLIKPRLHRLEIIPEKIGVPCRAFAQNQPFNVRLNLDMAGLTAESNSSLNYCLTVQARSLTNDGYETVTKGTGVIIPSSNVLLELQAAPLLPGVYQFAAALTLNPQSEISAAQHHRHPTALFKGGLFEVY